MKRIVIGKVYLIVVRNDWFIVQPFKRSQDFPDCHLAYALDSSEKDFRPNKSMAAYSRGVGTTYITADECIRELGNGE